MKKNNNKGGRQKLMAVIAVLIVLAMVLSIVVPIFAAPSAASKEIAYYDIAETAEENTQTKIAEEDTAVSGADFELDAEVGFDGVFMINRQTPVKVTVYNSGEDFKGYVEVKVYTSVNTMYSPSSYILYTQDADIASGGAGEYSFTVYPEAGATYMNIRLADENGNTVASINKQVTPFTPEQVMTAVVTDSKSSNLDYLKNLKIGEDIYNNRSGYTTNYVAFIDADTFPDSAEVMNCFGAVIIDDFNTESLSEKQISALVKWTEKGGLLIIGTGLNAEKTLKGLEDAFDFTFEGYDKTMCFGGSADTAVIDVPDAEATEIQGGKEISKTLDFGDGKIIVHTFDLGADPAASMDNAADYFTYFYRNTMPEKFSSNRNYEYYPEMIDSVNRLPSIEKKQLMVLLGILAVYIIAVGPICYIVLKKKDKREKGWVVIPAIAVIFSGIIFAISATSYQKDSLINFMTYTDLDSASPSTMVSVGIRTPGKGDVTLSLGEKINVYDTSQYYGYGYYGSTTNNESICAYTVKDTVGGTSVTYHDQNAWEGSSFYTNIDSSISDAIDAVFTVKGSSIVGTIYNNLDYDLFDVIVGFGGQYQKFDRIEAGESLDISLPLSAEEYQKWIDNGYQMVRQMIYGLDENEYQDSMVFRRGVSSTEAYKLEQRYRLFNSLVYNNSYDLRENGLEITVAAFSEKRLIESDKELNGKTVNENWENLMVKKFETDLSLSDGYDIPFGYIFPDEIYLDGDGQNSGQYWDIYYYELYTNSAGNVSCEYDLSESGNISEIAVEWDNYDAFRGEPMVLNCETGEYEKISAADLKGNAGKYISSDGRFTLSADIYSDTYLTLPKINLKGGK